MLIIHNWSNTCARSSSNGRAESYAALIRILDYARASSRLLPGDHHRDARPKRTILNRKTQQESLERKQNVQLAARSVTLELSEIHEKFVFSKLSSRKNLLSEAVRFIMQSVGFDTRPPAKVPAQTFHAAQSPPSVASTFAGIILKSKRDQALSFNG